MYVNWEGYRSTFRNFNFENSKLKSDFFLFWKEILASTQPSLVIAPSSTTTARIGGRSSSTSNGSQGEASTIEFIDENVDTEKEEPEGKIDDSIETKLN